MSRSGITLASLVAVLPLALGGCVKLDFMFFPGVPTGAYELPDNHIPGYLLEEVSLQSQTGDTIVGVWAHQDDPGTTVLYSHGNGSNIDGYWDRVMLLWDEGYQVFIYDYPGYGKSTGDPSETGMFAAALAAHDQVVQALSDDPTDPLPAADLGVVYYGWSLGTAATCFLAADVDEPALMFLEAPMASAQALVEDSTTIALPSGYLIDMDLDNIGRIQRIQAPKVLMHGLADDYIASWNSEELYLVADLPKTIWLPAGADHGNVVCDGETPSCEGASDVSYDLWRAYLNGSVEEWIGG